MLIGINYAHISSQLGVAGIATLARCWVPSCRDFDRDYTPTAAMHLRHAASAELDSLSGRAAGGATTSQLDQLASGVGGTA